MELQVDSINPEYDYDTSNNESPLKNSPTKKGSSTK